MKLFLSLLLCCFCSLPMLAQTDRATITGTVTDRTGARLPSVEITVSSDATGTEVHSQTNKSGVYTVSSLPTGEYNVSFNAAGFGAHEIKDLRLDVGETRSLSIALDVANVASSVDVTPADGGLSKSSAEIGGVVHGSQATEIPLNGRNYVGLVSLVPGAIDSGTGTQDQVRFGGLSDEDNNWHLDGVDNSGINHQYEKVAIRLQPSTESIAEFRANSVVYSADQGGTPGGQIELVSKSGSNRFRGSAWEFLRNTFFDATPWNTHATVPTLHLNNFGANLGGPILKEKMFFFANWESLRQAQNLSVTGTVPSASFRAQLLATQPALAPILNQYPVGTVAITGNANAVTWYGNAPSTDHEDSGLARVDYRFNDRTNLFLRYTTDHYAVVSPGNLTGLGFTTLTTPNIVVGVTHTFSPTLINDAKFGFNRAAFTQGESGTLPYSVVVSGNFTNLDDATGSVRYDNSFNWVDDATLVRGRNTIKAGITVRRVQESKSSPSIPDEVYTYSTLAHFQSNLMDSDSYSGVVPAYRPAYDRGVRLHSGPTATDSGPHRERRHALRVLRRGPRGRGARDHRRSSQLPKRDLPGEQRLVSAEPYGFLSTHQRGVRAGPLSWSQRAPRRLRHLLRGRSVRKTWERRWAIFRTSTR